MAKKRNKRRKVRPPVSHINERRQSTMKLSIAEHIAASDRKIRSLAAVMQVFKWKFQETEGGRSFAIVAET